MGYRIARDSADATATAHETITGQILDQVWYSVRPQLVALFGDFISHPCNPLVFLQFEMALFNCVRELGRQLMAATLHRLEPEDPQQQVADLWFECGGYRRRNDKTANRQVGTLFGTLTLWRRGYRSWERNDKTIFPLEMRLGLVEGVTPALASRIGKQMAESGASQSRVLQILRDEHGVSIGAERLRKVTRHVSDGMGEFRQISQVNALLSALEIADKSRGSRKPVLAVGRDGITLREYVHRCFEVATAGTISVYDRRGRRVTTVYLAWPPELGQATMNRMLDDLLGELFRRWDGPLPQLAYVADSGGNESTYFEDSLRRMSHPRTGHRLIWQRVVDYYHVAERIWAMADCLFGKETREGPAWAKRMLKAIKNPSGPKRVLHSAASLFHRRELKASVTKDFWKAYRYIRKRTRFLDYHQYASKHIPLGSGVTEAACKTIYTQRLKLSGMRWTHDGAATLLNLRIILLSGTWEANFRKYLESIQPATLPPYKTSHSLALKIAA
jgi:hypothetical protein